MLGKDKNKIKPPPARKIKHPLGKNIFLTKDPPIMQICSTESSDSTAQISCNSEARKIICPPTQWFPVWSNCSPFPHPGYWQLLETFLVATSSRLLQHQVETTDSAKHPTMQRTSPHNKELSNPKLK